MTVDSSRPRTPDDDLLAAALGDVERQVLDYVADGTFPPAVVAAFDQWRAMAWANRDRLARLLSVEKGT